MVFESLKVVPKQRITSLWANTLVDAIELAYNLGRRGDPDAPFSLFYGNSGFFSQSLFVQGRPVIKDGDPISIYDIFSYAQSKITSAIDSAKVTSLADLVRIYTQGSRDILDLLYAKAPSPADVRSSIDSSLTAQYILDVRNKIIGLNINQYGYVGIRIADPLDSYGRVVISAPNELLSEFQPVSASSSVSATDNTSGLSVALNKGGRPNVNIYYSLGGAGNVYVEVSLDGSTWRLLDTISLSVAGSGIRVYQGIAYPYVRVRTDATAIDVVFEIAASR